MYYYYARYVIKGEKDIKKSHDYTILRQVFDDVAREGGDDWVEYSISIDFIKETR